MSGSNRKGCATRGACAAGLACAVSLSFLAGCGSQTQDGSPSQDGVGEAGGASPHVTFTEVYSGVLRSCTSCHAGFVGQIDGLDMSTQPTAYKNLVGASASRCTGTLVVAKNAASSVLYQKVTSPRCGNRMPENAPPLSQANVDLLKNWIDEGAPND